MSFCVMPGTVRPSTGNGKKKNFFFLLKLQNEIKNCKKADLLNLRNKFTVKSHIPYCTRTCRCIKPLLFLFRYTASIYKLVLIALDRFVCVWKPLLHTTILSSLHKARVMKKASQELFLGRHSLWSTSRKA